MITACATEAAHVARGWRAPIGAYLHIPFCRTICPYCDFVKERTRGAVPQPFVDAVCREIAAFEGPREAQSIFFGGGTPSLLAPHSLEQILHTLHERFRFLEPEITLEANPDDVTEDLLRAWRDLGVNRISMGVQSFDDRTLRYLGRRHDAAAARRACDLIAAHFDNWNLDLIFGAPPLEAWQNTLETTVAIAPPHVAAYGLTYETGTPFERRRNEAIDDETSLAMYQQLETALSRYDHYEISNFARPGLASRHNLVYWHNGEYAGFGTGAYSFVNGVRARNHGSTDRYLAAPGAKEESLELSLQEIKVETVIQHLRLRAGLPRAHYLERFGVCVEEDFAEALHTLEQRALIALNEERIVPTAEGFYLNNEIGLQLVATE